MKVLDRPRTWQIKATVRKFHAGDVDVIDGPNGRELLEHGDPFEVVTSRHNLLVNAGINRLEDLLIGAGGTAFNNANSRIGVGDDTTAASASQTDLQAAAGSTHRQFEVMDATYPSRSSQTITWRATFTSGEANFHWQEWCIDNGTAASTAVTTPMLNRKVTDLGTKVSGAVWQFTVTLTIS